MKPSKGIILQKSRELFERFGYQKTTLTDIAKSTGKVKTAIYYYFSGKEEIFAELVRVEAEEFLDELIAAIVQQTTATKKLECYIETRVLLMEKIAQRYRFLKREFFELIPIVEQNRVDADQREITFLTDIFSNGISANEFSSSNPDFSAQLLMQSIKGLEIQMYVTDQMPINQSNIKEFAKFMLYGAVQKH